MPQGSPKVLLVLKADQGLLSEGNVCTWDFHCLLICALLRYRLFKTDFPPKQLSKRYCHLLNIYCPFLVSP